MAAWRRRYFTEAYRSLTALGGGTIRDQDGRTRDGPTSLRELLARIAEPEKRRSIMLDALTTLGIVRQAERGQRLAARREIHGREALARPINRPHGCGEGF